jgi:hypothetical protein
MLAPLGTSPALAAELWQSYTALYPETARTLTFALENVTRVAPALAEVQQRVDHVERLLPPKDLLAMSLRLAPEGRGPRRRDMVRFEQALLKVIVGPETWR